MKAAIIYYIISVIWQICHVVIDYFGWKKSLRENEDLRMTVDAIFSNLRIRLLKQKIFVPMLIIMSIALLLSSPLLLPIDLVRYFRRLIFGKTKLQKDAEEQELREGRDNKYDKRGVEKETMFDWEDQDQGP